MMHGGLHLIRKNLLWISNR